MFNLFLGLQGYVTESSAESFSTTTTTFIMNSVRIPPRTKIKLTLAEKQQASRIERREKIEQLGNELGISKLDDWYHISHKIIAEKGGSDLLLPYRCSMYKLFKDLYPSHDWIPWNFSEIPRNSLSDTNQRTKYIHWIASKLGIQKLDDWYKITTADLRRIQVLKQFYNRFRSLHEALQEAYPEHHWMPWFFSTAPKGFFMHTKNQRDFFDWLGTQFGIKNLDDWYSITAEKVEVHGGGRILCLHNFSLFATLSKIYPEHDWKIWKFHSTPRNTWTNERASQFVHEISEKLEIKQLDDWYRISRSQLAELSAISVTQHYGSLYHLLKTVYPHHPWQPQLFRSKAKKSAQRWLKVVLTKLFPNEEIFEDFQHPDIALEATPLQLDIFIPKLNLAFEYQGEQHYKDLYFFAPQARYQVRDNFKIEKCKENNLTLIEVPYWWDRKEGSLAATIQQAKLDIKLNIQGKIAFSPIPDKPPALQNRSRKGVIESQPGERLALPIDLHAGFPLMIATDWKEDVDVSGWLMSKKYDGMRAYWSSKDKVLYSRQGNIFKVPSFWTQGFPPTCDLDGELWCEEGYNDLVEIMQSKKEDSWIRVKFQAFDSVTINSSKEPYKERYNRLLQMKKDKKLSNNIEVVEHVVCKGKEDMKKHFESVVANGGEGVILRDPNSVYLPEISSKFLKMKPSNDTEVKFVAVKMEKGFSGLVCQQSNGLWCFVHSDAEVASNPPPSGTIISVKYSGVWKSGRLKNPYFFRIVADRTI